MKSRQYVPIRPPRTETRDGVEAPEAAVSPDERAGADDLIGDIDELLDEIDAVLEDQAVLVNFRQRSGQ
jgi:hypothetical protein